MATDGGFDQEIGDFWIFGQDWPVQIGSNAVFVHTTLGLVFPVISCARYDSTKGLAFVFEGGQSGMVFVADNFAKLIIFDIDIADEALVARGCTEL